MDITIFQTFLPHEDPDASLRFYRDILGFQVRGDDGSGTMRTITVGSPRQPGASIVLEPPGTAAGLTADEHRMLAELMHKASYTRITLATQDLDGVFEQLVARGAEVIQEPIQHPLGVRDCAFLDPAGNIVRIQEMS